MLDLAQGNGETGERERISLTEVSRGAWHNIDSRTATLDVDPAVIADADPAELRTLSRTSSATRWVTAATT